MADTKHQIEIVMSADTPVPPVEGANWFHFTVVGPEIQLLVGNINLLAMHQAQQGGAKKAIVPEISHRFLLSANGFAVLKAQIDEIAPAVGVAGMGIMSKAPK